ncbi:phosphatidylinositol mannoside acyltransferase [Streptomyces sp. NPDC005438]|uniref:phosphatidylinositol mannoside acyltransferase n=1 Tax=Streptomyces sp. NPDC005438 TaxID=3156880 RepID=UPI0033BA0B9D
MTAFTERFADGLYGLGWATVKRLPASTAYRLGDQIAYRTWRRRGQGVRQLEANLARVVDDPTPERLAELSRQGLRSYLRYWMESFRLPVWTPEEIGEHVTILDSHHLTDGIASDRGVILALPHMANYDLAGAWLTRHLGTPFTTVVERLRPESLYDRFVAYRTGLGMEVLPHSGGRALATLAARLRAGGLVCLVADRDLSAAGGTVDFFGQPARMPSGPAQLALRTGALLLPVTLWYEAAPAMVARVHPPVEPPTPSAPSSKGGRAEQAAAMTQTLADTFARGIAQHPTDWHMLQPVWEADLASPRVEPDHPGRAGV